MSPRKATGASKAFDGSRAPAIRQADRPDSGTERNMAVPVQCPSADNSLFAGQGIRPYHAVSPPC